MALPPVYGHEDVRAKLRTSLRSGNLAQSLLLHGPAGIGKERMGLWLAQLTMCASPLPGGEACGVCQPCRSRYTSFCV